MSSSRPSPSSRDDNSFSSRPGSGKSGGGSSRSDASRSTGSSRPGADVSRPAHTPAAPPKANPPRVAAGATGAGAGAKSDSTAPKAAASGGMAKWAGLAGLGVVALGGFMMLNGRASNSSTGTAGTTAPIGTRKIANPAPSQPGKLTVFVAADVSRSVSPAIRETSMDGLKFALRQGVPGGTSLHFVFYDKDARTRPNAVEFYEPRDLDEVASDYKKYVSRPEKGTTQALALKRLDTEAANLPGGTPYAYVLITDGEDYDQPATRQQAEKLAANSDFRGLMVIGAQMESKSRIYLRDQIQDSLSPLGNKRLVCGAEVSEHDADEFQSLLNR